jgi:type IV secretion system protein VirB6
MDDIVIFQFIGEILDDILNSFVDGTAGKVISTFTGFFVIGCSIHLTMLGYLIGWGYVELPFSTFMKTCAKYLIIGGLALSASTYIDSIAGSIRSLETGFTSAFSADSADSGTEPTSVYEIVDETLTKGWAIAADLWEKAGNRRITEFGMMMGEYINATIIALATFIIAVPAGGIIVIAKTGLTIMLGIGPVFLAFLVWPYTAKFFDSWLGQAMTYILRIALTAAVLALTIDGFGTIVDEIDLDGEQNTMFTSLVLITFTVVMFWLITEMNSVASQLAGGISGAAVTLRGMASGAMAPARAIGRAVNAPSTRRDLQSGMMVTAGRLNHLVAGNTMANPAYRQYLMKNRFGLGAWGRAKGGSVKEQ